jgi:hypothetical protein
MISLRSMSVVRHNWLVNPAHTDLGAGNLGNMRRVGRNVTMG